MRQGTFIDIGKFRIITSDESDDKVLIYHKSGEGGEFSIEAFEKVVKEFYDKNF